MTQQPPFSAVDIKTRKSNSQSSYFNLSNAILFIRDMNFSTVIFYIGFISNYTNKYKIHIIVFGWCFLRQNIVSQLVFVTAYRPAFERVPFYGQSLIIGNQLRIDRTAPPTAYPIVLSKRPITIANWIFS